MIDLFVCVITAVVGLLIGVISGMLGVGGGTIMVPVFRLGFDLPAIAATATSLFTIIFISLSGAATHIRNKTCIVPLGIAAGVGGAIMSPVGVYLATLSPSWAIMLAAAIVIIYSSYNMIKKAMALPSKKKLAAQAAAAKAEGKVLAPQPSIPTEPPVLDRATLMKALPIGFVAGLCSGYVGVGGGFIMVPMFLSILDIPMRYSSGSSLIAIILIAIPGVIEQLILGNVNIMVGAIIALGAIPGAVLGATFAKKIPERQLRIMFACVLIFSAIMLVVKELI